MKNCPKCGDSEKLNEYPFPRRLGPEGGQIIQVCAHCGNCGFDWAIT